ncbi:MAG TPA: hypothetical protein DD713_10130 [Nitrospiraceae bacterium]|nr:hypothetical protein [Nitrospiraceae bacterium]
MNNVLEQLKKYSKEIDLSSRFLWEFDGTFLNSIPQIGSFVNGNFNNPFERNEALKFKLTEYFQQNPSDVENLHFWIINDWGGIKNFKNNDQNRSKIKNFKNEIKNERLTRGTFSTISSLSKLSSFWDCKNFVIYDSRVIYSLNWLILKLSKEKKYYPTPAGRSEVIANYNIDTVIRLFHKDKNRDEDLYFSYKEAYHKYCHLMKDWSMKLWHDNYSVRRQYPFYLEMLLFLIADKEIFEDIKTSIHIEIK